MAPPSDSGYESDTPYLPPLDFRGEDQEIYEHLARHSVIDAKTGRKVDSNTTIASLYTGTPEISNPRLLHNLTRVAEPKVSCQLKIESRDVFPPKAVEGEGSYSIKVTYNKLIIAPVLRLETSFVDPKKPNADPYLTLVVEFHFNNYSRNEADDSKIEHARIENFSYVSPNHIKFTAGRATCSGFNLIPQFNPKLTAADQEFIAVLKSFLVPARRHSIHLQLHQHDLNLQDRIALGDIKSRLPGGSRRLLPSIGTVEYEAFGPELNHIHSKAFGMRKPRELMAAKAPFPYVPMEPSHTFSTVKEMQVKLAYGVVNAHAEANEALEMWSKPPHQAKLFFFENFMVLGINFSDFDKLEGVDKSVPFKLPHDIECNFGIKVPDLPPKPTSGTSPPDSHNHAANSQPSFLERVRRNLLGTTGSSDPNITPKKYTSLSLSGILMGSHPGRGIEPHSAFFQITSHPTKFFKERYESTEPQDLGLVTCTPHFNSFTFSSQMDTIAQIAADRNKRWLPLLLNQDHGKLEVKDMTSSGIECRKGPVKDFILKEVGWNEDQKKILDAMQEAIGWVVLAVGPAATGKTLLQRFLILYFYYLGLHVIAVAPANDNVNKLARDLHEYREELRARPNNERLKFNFIRLFPSSRDDPAEEISEDEAKHHKVGHEDGYALSFNEFRVALEQQKKEKLPHRQHGLAERIIENAKHGGVTAYPSVRDELGYHVLQQNEDAYGILREFIESHRKDEVPWKNEALLKKYRAAYRVCKGRLVEKSRIVITTTGNIRAKELQTYFYNPEDEGGVERRGVIVIVDEAAKDILPNGLAPVLNEKWSSSIKGVCLFGDDKQLQPANPGAKGNTMFNPFLEQLDISLPKHLIAEGFKCHRLYEQRRMHPVIADFPNRKIYSDELVNGTGSELTINDQMPRFREVLVDIISSSIAGSGARREFIHNVSDDDLRRHYIEVTGRRIKNPATMSSAVVHHVDVFFNKIFPKLRAYFAREGKSMEKEVMIICAYAYALGMYKDRFREMRDKDPTLKTEDLPRVVTIDSSQGDESFMVFFDASLQHSNILGFMNNRNRFNVAITRAKGVLWMVGGKMERAPWSHWPVPESLPLDYKTELDEAGQTHRFTS